MVEGGNGNGDTLKIKWPLFYVIVPVSVTLVGAVVGLYVALAVATDRAQDAQTRLTDAEHRLDRMGYEVDADRTAVAALT